MPGDLPGVEGRGSGRPREVDQQLIRQVDVEGGSGLNLGQERPGSLLSNSFGRHAAAGQGIGSEHRRVRLRPEYERAALSDGFLAPICPFLDLDVRKALETPRRGMLHPLWGVTGQLRDMANSPNALALPHLM